MYYKHDYIGPLGKMITLCDADSVKGIWFANQKHLGGSYSLEEIPNRQTALTDAVEDWLRAYFAGQHPSLTGIPLEPEVTSFQKRVLAVLQSIPYGKLVSYREIAHILNQQEGYGPTSPRAVGTAVARNPIMLLIPCHRVLSSTGKLTGYAGGLERKKSLLLLEQAPVDWSRQ